MDTTIKRIIITSIGLMAAAAIIALALLSIKIKEWCEERKYIRVLITLILLITTIIIGWNIIK